MFFIISLIAFSSSITITNSYAGDDNPLIKIPGGTFKSGPDGKSATVSEFYIDKFEVTNKEFKKFKKGFTYPAGKDNHPVAEITYFDAKAYCKSLGQRLPTQLEWEKAARGTDGRIYPYGNDYDAEKANTFDSGAGDTVAVGSYKNGKSPYGVMDMSGNVAEWVASWADKNKQYRLLMGGSFFDDDVRTKTYSSNSSIPDDTHPFYGFRCAK